MGANVRRARLALALTQEQLQNLSGVSQPTISRLERGLAPGLRLERLAAIIAALDQGDLRFLRAR